MDRPIRIPGPDHPIAIHPSGSRVVIKVGELVVADSVRALKLTEAAYPAVYYIPREDVNVDLLAASEHASYCPFKGQASYHNLSTDSAYVSNIAWSYEEPYAAVCEIAGHLAFYADRVATEVHPS